MIYSSSPSYLCSQSLPTRSRKQATESDGTNKGDEFCFWRSYYAHSCSSFLLRPPGVFICQPLLILTTDAGCGTIWTKLDCPSLRREWRFLIRDQCTISNRQPHDGTGIQGWRAIGTIVRLRSTISMKWLSKKDYGRASLAHIMRCRSQFFTMY